MNQQEMIHVLESLAYGKDPETGSGATAETFQSARTIRALFTVVAMIRSETGTKRNRDRNGATLTSAGTLWSKHEDARLCQEHEQGMTRAQIALQHGRSSGAITTRLVKLGRIEAPERRANKNVANVA